MKKINNSVNLLEIDKFLNKNTDSNVVSEEVDKHQRKKILIFDINPLNDEIIGETITGKIASVVLRASNEVQLIFVSIFGFEFLEKLLIKDLKLKKGIIISNNGARIYDIENNHFLFSSNLSEDQKLSVFHSVSVLSFLTIGSSNNNELVYYSNHISLEELKKRLWYEIDTTFNYKNYDKFLKNNKIYSFICYEPNTYNVERKYNKLLFLADELELNISTLDDQMFVITNNKSSKLKAIHSILDYLHFSTIENIFYFVLNGFDKECWYAFSNNHYISIEYKLSKKMKISIENTFYPSTFNILLMKIIKSDSELKGYIRNVNYSTILTEDKKIDPDSLNDTKTKSRSRIK